jgi:hypothetical protein
MFREGVSMSQIHLEGRLNGIQRNRLKRLFNMMYSPSELAEELSINTDQIYSIYVPLGCPHERDQYKHILINGAAFSDWYVKEFAKIPLQNDETFCRTCKKGVKIFQPSTHTKGSITYVLSVCPHCGRKLTKIIEYKRVQNDQ